ncbi:unnamed protein product [Somion occarium]|uniref:Uncharacterized protein n=1 Tax=Somion occarium TaxID=3059160 RepID=A0ABP1D9D7_9APHY
MFLFRAVFIVAAATFTGSGLVNAIGLWHYAMIAEEPSAAVSISSNSPTLPIEPTLVISSLVEPTAVPTVVSVVSTLPAEQPSPGGAIAHVSEQEPSATAEAEFPTVTSRIQVQASSGEIRVTRATKVLIAVPLLLFFLCL